MAVNILYSRMANSVTGTGHLAGGARQFRFGPDPGSASPCAAGSVGSSGAPAIERSSLNHAPKSTIRQRSLQKGRQRELSTHSTSFWQVGQWTTGDVTGSCRCWRG